MAWSYAYTPHIWPVLASAAFFAVLAIHAMRHRTSPGAVPFAILATLEILLVLVNGLGLASTEDTTRIFWFKFEAALLLPLTSAGLCFSLEYAGLGKWLSRRLLVLLAIPVLAAVPLILTNEIHHLVWTRIWFDGHVRAELGPAKWLGILYGYFLSLLQLMALAWLFARSPRHRWIAGGLIIAIFGIRCAWLVRFTNWNPVAPMDPMVVVLNFALLLFALAIFRFHMFDVVSVARDTVIEGMADGMMVLDNQSRIADVNEAVQKLLGIVRSKVIGSQIVEVLQAYPDLLRLVYDSGKTQCEVSFGNTHARWYQVSISPLSDRRNFQLGRLISFHDITVQKRTQAQLLDHQRTLATLKERELLARELHDGIGQMLAAAHLQVKSANELLARGDTVSAESCLHTLAEVTQETKESIREYLLGIKTCSSAEQDLIAVLHQYLNQYSHNYGIHTELVAPPELEGKRIDSTIEVQLQPIIQEALTNVRRHAGACSARVIFAFYDGQIQITIEDDGRGFDPEAIRENQGFGLRSMRGRADMVGARLEVISALGKGTQVIIQVPWQKEGK
jgi:PAS domain S-box-containing protein